MEVQNSSESGIFTVAGDLNKYGQRIMGYVYLRSFEMGNNFVHNFSLGQVGVIESWSIDENHFSLIEFEMTLLDIGSA